MHLFLTGVLPFLAHDHPAAAAFLTCRHHNFHSSIIPEFLSDEERVQTFCAARQQNQLKAGKGNALKSLYYLFVQTPLMQFSPSLVLSQKDCNESIIKPLLATKYFTRTLQRCSVGVDIPLTNDLLQCLSKVRSLTKLDVGENEVENVHFEIIINSFPSLESLSVSDARTLVLQNDTRHSAIRINSPPPPATKTLRSLALHVLNPLIAIQFVPNFPNLRKLELSPQSSAQELDLLPLSSSLPLLTDLSLECYKVQNAESIQNLVRLSSLQFCKCCMPDNLSFLRQENSLPELTTLRVRCCIGLSASSPFASLVHVPNLQVLDVSFGNFDNDCLQYLEDTVHLRKLDLSFTSIVGDSRSLKTLMQNLFQLEDLNLRSCHIGNQGAIAGALYSTHSRLRVLNLSRCTLVDDDLNGIGVLKDTLEVLDLNDNIHLTTEALVHCKDLVKLKKLNLSRCYGIDDLSPLKDCCDLEELNVSICHGLTDDSFKVFSKEPNSFPNLRALDVTVCEQFTEKVLEHLSKNNHLVYQLKKLSLMGSTGRILPSSPSAQEHVFRLQGLQELSGALGFADSSMRNTLKGEFFRNLKNLEIID